MKKTVFLKNGPSHNLHKIKYVISEPHEDLLQRNLSWALTFDFLHQERVDTCMRLHPTCNRKPIKYFLTKVDTIFYVYLYISVYLFFLM